MKVGHSRNPQVRLAHLQTSHYEELQLIATVQGGVGMETTLHTYFKDQKLSGEWFNITKKDIADAIHGILAGTINPVSEIPDESPDDLLTKYEQARALIIDLLQEFDEWVPAVELEDAIIAAGPCRRIVKQVRATLCREGLIQKRKVADEWQWRIG